MPLITISSIDDPRVRAYSKLTESQLRNKADKENGIFIAESPKVISVALDKGYQVRAMCSRGECSAPCADRRREA